MSVFPQMLNYSLKWQQVDESLYDLKSMYKTLVQDLVRIANDKKNAKGPLESQNDMTAAEFRGNTNLKNQYLTAWE